MGAQRAADKESAKLEARYAKQEAEREAREKERREREVLEAELAATTLRSGFNVD
jgi:hypothetical protein